jgi:hypothetical protein
VLAALPSSRRPPDARHPFGYGKERFFGPKLAAVGIFVMGGCFPSTGACTRCSRPVPGTSDSILPSGYSRSRSALTGHRWRGRRCRSAGTGAATGAAWSRSSVTAPIPAMRTVFAGRRHRRPRGGPLPRYGPGGLAPLADSPGHVCEREPDTLHGPASRGSESFLAGASRRARSGSGHEQGCLTGLGRAGFCIWRLH